MKRLLQSIVLGLAIAAFALPTLAQDPAASPQPAAQDEAAAKSELYKKFTAAYNRGKEILKADPNLAQPGNRATYDQAAKEAYDLARDYVQKYPGTPDDKIFAFQKNYITTYEKSQKEGRKSQLTKLFNDKKYDEAFSLGRQILNDDPNDLATLYTLSRGGLFAAATGSETNNAATAQYAKKAIQLIQAGGALPGEPKEETLGILNYAVGITTIKASPSDAVGAFYQVASLPNSAKSDPQTFYLLAVAYQAADYDKLASDYKVQCTTAEQIASPTCKAMTDRLNMVVDRVVDAYARAIALSGTNPKFANSKTEWMKSLTDFYKFRHEGKEDGLKEYIAGIANQPLPGPLPPAGTMPAPTGSTPSATPAATPSSDGSTSATPSTTTTPTTAKPDTATTTPKTTTPKTATTTPKTSPKKAHASRRRH